MGGLRAACGDFVAGVGFGHPARTVYTRYFLPVVQTEPVKLCLRPDEAVAHKAEISYLHLCYFVPLVSNMTEPLKARLRRWRGKMYRKEAAAKLGVGIPTYRAWETGRRTPTKIAEAEIERRMEKTT